MYISETLFASKRSYILTDSTDMLGVRHLGISNDRLIDIFSLKSWKVIDKTQQQSLCMK